MDYISAPSVMYPSESSPSRTMQKITVVVVTCVLVVAFVNKVISTYVQRNSVLSYALPIAIGLASMFSANASVGIKSKSVQSGLMVGGLLLVLNTVWYHWDNIDNNVKVMILGGSLGAVIYGGNKIMA